MFPPSAKGLALPCTLSFKIILIIVAHLCESQHHIVATGGLAAQTGPFCAGGAAAVDFQTPLPSGPGRRLERSAPSSQATSSSRRFPTEADKFKRQATRARRQQGGASAQEGEQQSATSGTREPVASNGYGPFERPANKRARVGAGGSARNNLALEGGGAQEDDSTSQNNGAAAAAADRLKVIETAVFIDQALGTKFNGLNNGLVELNKLVLTIMNQVQYLFEYSSLQVPLKLRLVLIEHLKESERQLGLAMPNAERGDIDAYLGNFCNWQQDRLSRETRLWWDHAILLSGLDLYKVTPGKNHSGVLGLAWVGGMCKGNYSCTINEASNFESAFVIAHEIGHSLGIMHDGQKNRCDPSSFIMSERTGAGKVHWSKCSNVYLNESVQRGQLACLDSEQNNQIDSLYDLAKLRAPGQVYAINEQCKLAFGANYSAFVSQQAPFNAVCRELWCVAGTWAKAAHPALEGSLCGEPDRLCREGKCAR